MSFKKIPIFARDATGFTREISTFSAFAANLCFINIPIGALTYTSAPYIFPGSDVVSSTILATVFSICISVMYTLFTWAMPRSGGDYVLMSRVINPVVGFVASFNLNFWYIIFVGITANWVTTLALAPSILTVGTLTSDQSLIGLANTISAPSYVAAIGLVVTVVTALIMVRGVRATFRLINLLFFVSLAGVVVMIWLMASNTNAAFINAFDKFASYQSVIASAHGAGYSPSGPNALIATLGVMPFIFGSTGYGIVTSYFAGEAKSIKKNALYSQVASTAVAGAILALLGGLAVNVFGYDFLGSISQLYYTGSSAYTFTIPVYLNLFVSMLTNNLPILWLLAISYVASQLIPVAPTYMIATRSIFAWSFDRVIPTKFSEISDRFHTPIFAVALVAIIQGVGLIAYTYGPAGTFLSLVGGALMAEIFSFIVVALAAIAFPFKQRKLYDNTPAKLSIGGVPIITIFGVVSLGFYLLLEYFFLTNPLYGANVPIVYDVVAVVLAAPLLVYVLSHYYHKSKGLDLSLAFKQLPPE